MLAVPEASFPSDALRDLLRDAATQRVELRIWPLLPRDQGYWPNETNIQRFDQYVGRILAWLKAQGLSAGAIIYDMEPAIAYSKTLEQANKLGLGASVKLMRQHLNPAAHAMARQQLIASVRAVQQAGLRAQCVTFPQVLDDLGDGDNDLQDALDIPVHGVPWDEVSFMVYQSTYARMLGSWIGPDLIRAYSAAARAAYGDRATIALGVVGKGGVMSTGFQLYKDPATLQQDIAAARAEGIKRLEVFSLDGMLTSAKPAAWLSSLGGVQPRKAESSATTDLAQKAMIALDLALDK